MKIEVRFRGPVDDTEAASLSSLFGGSQQNEESESGRGGLERLRAMTVRGPDFTPTRSFDLAT